MELQAGKFYKTRDGRKAYVAAVGNPFDGQPNEVAVGWVENEGVVAWCENGSWVSCGTDRLDLVSEWRDPVKAEVRLFLYADGIVSTKPIPAGPIATKTVTITEGEGMS